MLSWSSDAIIEMMNTTRFAQPLLGRHRHQDPSATRFGDAQRSPWVKICWSMTEQGKVVILPANSGPL
jgi:hypothetical protein